MTRFLSKALQAPEPYFRHGLMKLEADNGHPNTDIRFSTEVMHESRAKVQALGLNPSTASAQDIYEALQRRIAEDDIQLYKSLRTRAATHISAEGDLVSGMIHALQELPDSKRCYALKSSVLKSLIRKQPPKKAMKQLGYRSLASFLKHETAASILAAAWLSEGGKWQAKFQEQYKKLKASDFESRDITFLQANTSKWQQLAANSVAEKHHNILSFKELGALVFLPLNQFSPIGSTTASLSIALHELNEIRSFSTYLKLCQVRADFGEISYSLVKDESTSGSELFESTPWKAIHKYFAGQDDTAGEQVFEPHLQMEDLAWHPIENTLSAIEPRFEFWKGSGHLGILHEDKPVSFNVLDAALNHCNLMSFESRISKYFSQSLWEELAQIYTHRGSAEKSVIRHLQPEYAAEMATV